MQTINYSNFRKQLSSWLDKVNADHEPVVIHRQGAKPSVLLSLEDYEALDATAYLMASPANKKRLIAAREEIEQGATETQDLIDP